MFFKKKIKIIILLSNMPLSECMFFKEMHCASKEILMLMTTFSLRHVLLMYSISLTSNMRKGFHGNLTSEQLYSIRPSYNNFMGLFWNPLAQTEKPFK